MANISTHASGAIWWPNLQPMHVAPSGLMSRGDPYYQFYKNAPHASGAIWWAICNSCNWRHLVVNFKTNASGAIWWPILQLMQVAPSGGKICNLCKLCHLVANFVTKFKWRHLVAKFVANASGVIWCPCKKRHLVAKIGTNTSCITIWNQCY